MKKYIYPMALAATLLTTTGCSDDEVNDAPVIPDDQKEMISFSVSDEANSTRAGFLGSNTHLVLRIQSTDRTNSSSVKYTRTVATAAKDVAGGVNDYSVVSFNNSDKRYWDDAHGRKSLLSIFAVAVPNGGNSINNNNSTLESLITPGDASAVWGTTATNTIAWKVTTSEQTKDPSSATTPTNTIDQEDLVYSNNIQAGGKDGVYRWNGTTYDPADTGANTHHNGQMVFFQNGMTDETAATATVTDAPGHFDKGHLVFNHALSRITVTLEEGAGFDKESSARGDDFKFKDGTNIKLLSMNTSGTLNLTNGTWSINTPTDINLIALTESGTTTAAATNPNSQYYTLTSQMLPDYVFEKDNNDNVMQFTIDNNTYFITKGMLFKALYDNAGTEAGKNGLPLKDADNNYVTSYKMEQGKNYVFKIVVDKTQIKAITATLAPWVEVTAAEYKIDNSHILVETKKVNGDACDDIKLFRLEETLDQIYTDDSYLSNGKAKGYQGDYKENGIATMRASGTNGIWNTNWYYKDNITAYHLRSLNTIAADGTNADSDDACENVTTPTSDPKYSYFTMVSGDQSTQDYHWGAPMITSADLKYNETAGNTQGYVSSLHQGLVAPKNGTAKPINITELHMMSNINIRLVTDSVATATSGVFTTGSGAVNLKDATITLTRFAKTGTVDMGTGFVSPIYPTTTHTHNLGGDDYCAKIVAPSFTSGYWVRANASNASTDWFRYAVVPQALRRSDAATPPEEDCVGITIQTADNNEYYVITDLATIIATTVTDSRNQSANTAITRWYPGHTYYYTIKISKKGIDAITCTVAPWVDVIAKDIDIDLES